MATLTSEQILDQARKLTEKRMQSVHQIADATSARVEAEEALRKAELAEKKAFTDAEKSGWTKAELNKLRPTKKTRRAPKPTATSTTPPADADPSPGH